MAKFSIFLCLLGLIFFNGVLAQITTNELPPSFFESKLKIATPQIPITSPNIDSLNKEDIITDQYKDIPWRFGVEKKVNIQSSIHGSWNQYGDSKERWLLALKAPQAVSINLNFSKFHLPESAKLYISNADYTDYLGALTASNNKHDQRLSTRPIQGEEILIDLIVNAEDKSKVQLEISGIVYGYRSVFDKTRKTFGSSGNCNINIECETGKYWMDVAKSVVLITTSNNTRLCTGTLLNNVQNNNRPFVLTAAHCGLQTSSVFIFDYKSPNCSPNTDGSLVNSISTAFSRASNSGSDFHLFELSSNVPATFGATYAGWDMSNRLPSITAGIHHPSGDVKKISVDKDPPSTSGYFGSGTSHWRVDDWDEGTTEGGSSGSALFDEFQRVIGQLEGGRAACGNDLEDYYGKTSVSWNNGTGSTNRLRDWLDPLNTGTLVINSKFSNIPANQRDFASIYIDEPPGLSCGTDSIDSYVLLKNLCSDTVRELKVAYLFNATVDTLRWNGTSTYGEVIKINTPKLPLINGLNQFRIVHIGPSTANNILSNDTLGFEVNAITQPIDVFVTIKTDNYGSETSWEINGSSNRNYYSGGPYTDINGGRIYRDTVCLFDSCFNFVLKDSYGDGFSGNFGNGFALITDSNGDTLLFENAFFSSAKTISFCPRLLTSIQEIKGIKVGLHPNPVAAGGILEIEYGKVFEMYRLYQLNGQLVESADLPLNHQIRIPEVKSGLYFLELIEQDGSRTINKVMIANQ